MSKFETLWDSEVKKLAVACIEPNIVSLSMKDKDYKLTEDEKKLCNKFVDPLAMFYISNMIFRVEHGLADARDYQSKLAVFEIRATLHSESYLKEVWHIDDDSDSNSDEPLTSRDEYKKLMALRDGLDKLVTVS